MKPRLTTWGSDSQFLVHRGDDRLLIDLMTFTDEAAAWATVYAWLADKPAGFDLAVRYGVGYSGMIPYVRAVMVGVERGVGGT